MKDKVQRVSVKLEEETLKWARMEAARTKTTLSGLLGAILRERMSDDETYLDGIRRALVRKPFLKSNGRYLSRSTSPGSRWRSRLRRISGKRCFRSVSVRTAGGESGYFFGGYLSIDFFTMSSILPSSLAGSVFSSLATPRQTRDRVAGSRRSITSVPSA